MTVLNKTDMIDVRLSDVIKIVSKAAQVSANNTKDKKPLHISQKYILT